MRIRDWSSDVCSSDLPEGRRLFPSMTVLENLLVGASAPAARQECAASLDKVFAMFQKLRERRGQTAGTLSGGEQQMVAIGRALMAKPELLQIGRASCRERVCQEVEI